jgi:uncharacterized protein (TIGR03000 family)
MYSVVLMMALSGSADVPAFGHKGCSGCYGCSGYVSVSYGCEGCCGGGRHHHARHGCHGGYSCCGCTGSYGWSCHGGAYYGGCTGSYGWACHGGAYYGGCAGGYIIDGGGMMVEPAHHDEMKGGDKGKGGDKKPEPVKEPKSGDKEASLNAPATLVVSLPAEAKLSVDGYATKSTSSVRTLASPTLEAGKDYVYTLTAELVRDGKPVTTSKEVTVRAGEAINVALEFPQASFAQK